MGGGLPASLQTPASIIGDCLSRPPALPPQGPKSAPKCPNMGLASFGFFALADCNRLMLWKLSRTGSIVSRAEPAERVGLWKRWKGLEIEFEAGGD